jgi:hypothetical protein
VEGKGGWWCVWMIADGGEASGWLDGSGREGEVPVDSRWLSGCKASMKNRPMQAPAPLVTSSAECDEHSRWWTRQRTLGLEGKLAEIETAWKEEKKENRSPTN